MNFGQALEAIQHGHTIARQGWNSSKQFITYFSPVRDYPAFADAFTVGRHTYPLRPFLVIKTADDMFCTWVPSISDTLADDWKIVE